MDLEHVQESKFRKIWKISQSVGTLYFTTKSEFMTKNYLRLTDGQWQVIKNYLPVRACLNFFQQ
jgi:hypothetical protein